MAEGSEPLIYAGLAIGGLVVLHQFLSSGGGGEECTYQGYDRSEWGYDGSEQSLFDRWQNCEISTSAFDNQAPNGEGSSALVHPEGPCVTVSCGDGEVCEDGECVPVDPGDPCENVECGDGEVCEDGDCIVVDPCAGVDCGEFEECVDGTCVEIDPTDRNITLVIHSTNTEGVSFTFQVNGEPEMVTDAGNMSAGDSGDEIVELEDGFWEISGETGSADGETPYGDTFEYTATVPPTAGVVGFDASHSSSEYTILVNDEEISPGELPGLQDLGPVDPGPGPGPGLPTGPIGGGEGYGNLHTSGDYTVATESELRSALDAASSGDVVYVEGSAEIDIGGDRITVPSGVTLASNRGVDGAPGARIAGYASGPAAIDNYGTVEGLEIAGPVPDFLPLDDRYQYGSARGIEARDNSEVANCHVHHYTDGGIYLDYTEGVTIHHCEISDCPVEGVGYGIDADSGGGDSGRVVVEYCYMHTCRHEIVAHGGDGYILRNNIIGPDEFENSTGNLRQQEIDDHGCCGYHEVYNNTFRTDGEMFSFRDGTDDRATCHHNWFYDDGASGLGEFPNVSDNHFGSDEPPSDIGAPR